AQVLIEVLDGDAVVSTATSVQGKKTVIPVPDAKLWSPDSPFLYDLNIKVLCDGDTLDKVKGYFGMRKISLGKDDGYTRIYLNNQPIFNIGPLDQGFWPDGIYSATTDAAMLYDIQSTKQMGFNMIRKHIKVEPRRWYYHCDRLGMLVWQDMPSGNSYGGVGLDQPQFKKEMTAMINNLYNAPSIIMWIIFNESQGRHDVETLVKYVKSLDGSRLVNQDSQYGVHSTYVGDVWDIHQYPNPACVICPNKNLATVCGEYGGLKYKENGHVWGSGDWGYATMGSRKELMDTYEQYVFDLVKFRDCFGMCGGVYTQITDVEIEINGLITYDRAVVKVDFDRMAEINSRLVKSMLKKDTIIATAGEGGEMWKMTTTTPADNWYAADFDDSKWKTKKSGFGTAGTPNSTVGTTWNTSDIWIRKNFRLDGMNRAMADSLVMLLNHDEDCEIYVNGVHLASYEGYKNGYIVVDFTTSVKNALKYDEDNVIAIHCHQTSGGQYIDAGIYLLSKEGLTTSVKNIVADGAPEVAVDKKNKKVTVAGGGFGENTRVDIISAAGSLLSSAVVGNAPADLSALTSGVYVLRFIDGSRRYTCKVVL
ncbi:MAG: glycoside hydrolase family 2, partial [Bacteroidaceae bacterium]|nr:glycoside hydrolase family 2 [Bacteroidaceae bacterium]